jgi:hypothetical protein
MQKYVRKGVCARVFLEAFARSLMVQRLRSKQPSGGNAAEMGPRSAPGVFAHGFLAYQVTAKFSSGRIFAAIGVSVWTALEGVGMVRLPKGAKGEWRCENCAVQAWCC